MQPVSERQIELPLWILNNMQSVFLRPKFNCIYGYWADYAARFPKKNRIAVKFIEHYMQSIS